MQPVEDEKARGTGTLGKALSVLDIVASSEEPLRFTDLFNRCDQPRGTLHRQISNLIEEGLLTVGRDASYELGPRLLKFASRSWARNRFRLIAEPHLKALQARTGETVHLGVLNGAEVIYLDKVEGQHSIRMYSQIGNASPVYCTGVGKAALSALPSEALAPIVESIAFRRFTPTTITAPKGLLDELADIRRNGVAYDREEHEAGIGCVAAPIHSADRGFVAGISVTGPLYRVTMERLESWAPVVAETAKAIMDDMGTRLGPRS